MPSSIKISEEHINAVHFMSVAARQLKPIGIDYVERVTISADGIFSMISSNKESLVDIYRNLAENEFDFDFQTLKSTRYQFSHDLIKSSPKKTRQINEEKLKNSEVNYDIKNLFQILEINENHYESYAFGTSSKFETTQSKYLNNLGNLESFILWLKSDHMSAFNMLDTHGIIIPGLSPQLTNNNQPLDYSLPFINKIKRYYYARQHYFTKREFQIFALLGRGLSYKEIAIHLSISHRTVEGVLQNFQDRNQITKKHAIALIETLSLKYTANTLLKSRGE